MPNLALFDFDGTITDKDMFTAFIFHAVPAHRLRLGKLLLSPLVLAYKLGLVPPTVMRTTIVRRAFRGQPAADVRDLGVAFARDAIDQAVRPEMRERLRWHQDQGDEIVVVSASLDVYLGDWCARHGLGLLCSELEERDGVLTGGYRSGDCCGPEKARRVRERYDLQAYGTVYAYGDTAEDEALLSLAAKRYFQGREVLQHP